MMLQNVMSNYFNENTNNNLNESKNLFPVLKNDFENDMPVSISNSKWEITKSKASNLYELKTRKQKEAFVVEVLKYIRDSSCDIEILVRKNNVRISIYSLSPSLSELEFDCIKDIKKIKKDVSFYFAKKE